MSNETPPEIRGPSQGNIYLSGPILPLFAKTAAPIVLVMLVNGLFTVVDAYFLGIYVGADALVAVTPMFPLYMLLVALSTLVSTRFSSIYARTLGANDHDEAQKVFSSALTLFLFGPLMMIATYFQAIGDAMRAAVLGLSRTFVFAIPLTLALPFLIGEPGIW